MEKQIKVTQAIDRAPVAAEVMAEAIVSISQGIKKLREGRLNDKALVLLITAAAPSYGKYPLKRVSQRDVDSVLDGIANLERTFIKAKK